MSGREPDEPVRGVQLQPEELLSVLQTHDVEFVVIGGFSLAVHGVVRATKDIDIVPDPRQANLRRLGAALDELEARIDLGDLDPAELGIELDAEGLGHGGNFVLYTRHGRLDVMQDIPGIGGGYAQLRDGAVESEWPGISGPLLFAGYDALIAMKSAAGRDQDVMDIAALGRARGDV